MRKLVAQLAEDDAGRFLVGCLLLALVIVAVFVADFVVGTLGSLL